MDNSTAPAENKGHGVLTRARSCQTFVIKIWPRYSVYVAFCGSDEFDGVVLASGFHRLCGAGEQRVKVGCNPMNRLTVERFTLDGL